MDVFMTGLAATPVAAGPAGDAVRVLRSDKEAFWARLSFGVVALGALLVLLTFRDYGVTWDEDVHNWYGNFVLDYYLSLFDDRSALHWRDLYNYGAVFDMIAAALNRVSPIGIYETRHLLNGLVGVLGLIGCCKLAHTIAGARAGFIAALFLLLTPNYYGQMFNNPKDIPFAVGIVWSTYYMVRIVPTLPRPSLRLLAKLGAAVGMAMGVRIGGLLLLCYLALLLALDGTWRAVTARRAAVLVESAWSSSWRVLGPVVLVAYPVMLLFWPWAQTDPIENPLRALAFFSHQTFPFYTLFAGRFIPATDLPWSYLPAYIVLALPELVLVLLLCAPVVGAVALARGGFRLHREQALAAFVLGIGAQVQARLLGELLCRGRPRAGRLFAHHVWRGFRGARIYRGGVRPAYFGRLLLPTEFPVHTPARRGRFLHRLHQRQLRPLAARTPGLPGRANGGPALGRVGPPRSSRRAADR